MMRLFLVALRLRKSQLSLVHSYPEIFLLRFRKKYASLRSFFESISPVHTKTLKHVNTVASLTGDALYDV